MIEGKPESFTEALSMDLVYWDSPPSKFLEIWNDDEWYLPEQIGKTKNELDDLVKKGIYRKVVISTFCANSIRRSQRRAIYCLTANKGVD